MAITSKTLPYQILAGLALGIVAGALVREHAQPETARWLSDNIAAPIGNIFLAIMFMTIIPLILSALALGIAGLGDLRKVGILGMKVLGFTFLLSGIAVMLGIGMVNLLQPGKSMDPAAREILSVEAEQKREARDKNIANAEKAKTWAETISQTVPRNPVEAMANLFDPNPNYKGGGIISFLVFVVFLGVAITTIPAEKAKPLVNLLESIQEVSMAVIGFAMILAPLGVAALVFQTTSAIGFGIFTALGLYVLTVVASLLIHMLVVYSLALLLIARRSPIEFYVAIQEAIITAFSTSSSNATLPTSLKVAREKLGLPDSTGAFVLTVGATANQNGTALFEGVTVLFLAQFYNIDLTLGQQLTVVLMSIVAGIGTAGVPGGSLPLIVILLKQVGIPPTGIGIVLGVDRLLDMCRTTVNVVGDLVLATLVSPRKDESRVFDR